MDVLGHGLPQGSLARLREGLARPIRRAYSSVGAPRGGRAGASWSGGISAGSVSARSLRSEFGRACGRRASACRRVGPGLSAYAGPNRARSPPCMRCRGPRLASPHQGQPVAWPSRRGRAARQSQEPALGSGRPAPPTSRSRPRAVPVSNGESISTSSTQDSARPAPHLFWPFLLSTRCPQNMAGYPHSTRFSTVFYTGHPQATRRYLVER